MHGRVKARKLTRYDLEQACRVRRVFGYRAECDCGWRSPTFDHYWQARNRLTLHRDSEHDRLER